MQLMLAQPKIDVESPIVPLSSFDPPVVKPGEQSTYRVTLNALETAIDWPDKLPAPGKLKYRPGARGQILSMSGALLLPRTTFNYRVEPSGEGQFAIPEFTVMVNGKPVTIPGAQLVATATPPANLRPTQQLLFDLSTNRVFVGQTLRARIMLPGSPGGVVQSLGQVQINGQGFIADQSSAHNRIEALPLGPDHRIVNTFVYELMLIPIATGKLSLFAQGYSAGNRVVGGVIMPGPGGTVGGFPQYNLLDSDPISLEIRPLPRGAELGGFTGAVGTYFVDPPELSTNVLSIGEPIQLKVKLRGDGNLARVVPPSPPRLTDWQVFAATTENLPPQLIQAQGSVTFTYTLIPLTAKTRETPAIAFSSFDPERGAYEDLTIPSMPISVMPGESTSEAVHTLAQAYKMDGEPEKEPSLSGLDKTFGLTGTLVPVQNRAWFPLLHLVPATTLFALWLWDRRRRFLEQHPIIVLRRRALRAVRRERRSLQRAARARDSLGFTDVAVNALKLAVAPHYPAEPRALVGADVLSLLPEQERSGRAGQTIRALFSRADSVHFGVTPQEPFDLLKLKPEIEGVLDHLEAKLCD
jgi:hypothetical protein